MTLALSLILLLQAKSGIGAWDTGKPSPAPLNLEARSGWAAVEEGGTIKGDAVLSNGRVTAVFRRESGAGELGPGRFLLAGAPKLTKATLIENRETSAPIEATWQ